MAIDVLLALADAEFGPMSGTYVVAPLILAVVATPGIVAAGGAIAIAFAAASAAWAAEDTSGYIVRLLIVIAGSGLAYFAARRRAEAEQRAARLEALSIVGDVVQVSIAGVIAIDRDGAITLFNEAAERMFGRQASEVLGRDAGRTLLPERVAERFDAGRRRYLQTGDRRMLGQTVETHALRADGSTFPAELSVAVLGGDRALGFACFVRDLTRAKRAERDQRLLSETAELLASSVDYERTLREVAALAVPELADWCAVDVVVNGRAEPVAIAHRDPAVIPLAQELRRGYHVPDETSVVERTLRTGTPMLRAVLDEADLLAVALDERHLELLRAVGLCSLMVVPLKAGRRTIGAMTFAAASPVRRFTAEDVALAEELGRRAGTAVDNARLYEERSEIARTLQGALRPPALPDMPGWSAAAAYEPAGRANEVGGDFYDVFAVAGGWMLVIGDVIGKGAPAAALTSLARYSIRTAATLTGSPGAALAHLNSDLERQGHDALLSALIVKLTETPTGACAFIASAGHPLPLHVRGGVATPAGHGSLLLGVSADARFDEHEVELAVGDTLLLYTDGVVDARGEHERFGQERLVAAALAGGGEGDSADEIVTGVVTALEGFQHGGQGDDITLLAVRRRQDSTLRAGAPPARAA